jgi:hypothetical protein
MNWVSVIFCSHSLQMNSRPARSAFFKSGVLLALLSVLEVMDIKSRTPIQGATKKKKGKWAVAHPTVAYNIGIAHGLAVVSSRATSPCGLASRGFN